MDLISKLEAIFERYQYLEEQLGNPDIVSDMKKFAQVNKDYSDLKPIANKYIEYKDVLSGLGSAKDMLKDPDQEMREMAEMEVQSLNERKTILEDEINILLIPTDPEDSKDVIMEIRSGTGGDEAAIFAGDLYRMYIKYFDAQGWKYDILNENSGSQGGFSKLEIEITGSDVYGKLKFESGAHRVQRVPKTESQGRVHTSAATIVVMPIMEFEDLDINKADIKTDTFRASGAGGQHVNKTESGVRFTHLPTGLVAESTEARSQIKNREIAMTRLVNLIRDTEREKQMSEVAARRKSLVGTGDRSDKIRTYNYPQNRVTDHRINLTLYNLDQIMEGDVDNLIKALVIADKAEKMKGEEVM